MLGDRHRTAEALVDSMPCPKCGADAPRKSAAYHYDRTGAGQVGELLQMTIRFQCKCSAAFTHVIGDRPDDLPDADTGSKPN
jgi:hypothetical protein